jgi:uncharacterized protein YjbI with pentapeptide repeats
MRLQLILPPVAIILLVVAAVALWPAPQTSLPPGCNSSDEPNLQKGEARDPSDRRFLDTAGCTLQLSPQEAKQWWKSWRGRVADDKRQAVRTRLEACETFGPDPARMAEKQDAYCDQMPDLDVPPYASWLDWSDKWFFEASFVPGPLTLANVNLAGSTFEGGDLAGADLTDALLIGARFKGIGLARVDFSRADLRDARFSRHKRRDTNLRDANFFGANLDGALYEPAVQALPDVSGMGYARNLHGLRYEQSPLPLGELREALYKGGFNDKAREVTFAIERSRRVIDGASDTVLGRLSSLGRLIAFEWPVGYGMHPFRPLLVLLALIPIFAPVYYVAAIQGGRFGDIWIRGAADPIGRPSLDRWTPVSRFLSGGLLRKSLKYAAIAAWFSVMSAFRIGYRDINVGDWITRVQPNEYLLGATGWCRTVSGLQSLISVYLLALTVLCLIGRPFD